MKRRITLILFLSCTLFCHLQAWAQTIRATGKVVSKTDGLPLPGVSVVIRNTSKGTSTDVNGNFSITVPSVGTVLVFSQIGMKTQNVVVRNSDPLSIALEEGTAALDEVVVVGYGVQKKSVVTGAISSVKASALESMPINRVEQALQGRTSGVTIASSSGQPGAGSSVRIRGITTINNNDPLWVVDGVVVDNGGIGYLNQSDIESIEVLKDAASQAIYGARAASGVILITTKKGKAGDIRINYNGFYGTSRPARKLDLLNASQYAMLRNEQSLAAGQGVVFENPESFGKGTDWQSVIFNNSANRQTHELSVSGGSDKITFYTSFGYLDQEGIVTSEISKFKRMNFRINSTYKPVKWLTFGENVGYSYDKSTGLGNTNSEFGGPLSSAINLDPITPVVITDPNVASSSIYINNPVIRDANGNPYAISPYVQNEITNPMAYIRTREGNYSWAHNIVSNVYGEAEIIKGLKFRSTLGAKLAYWGNESFTPIFFLNNNSKSTQTSFNRGMNMSTAWNVENTLSYTRNFGKHTLVGLIGQGAYLDNNSRNINVSYYDIPVSSFGDASLNYSIPRDKKNAGGGEGAQHKVASVFARLNYNYDERYLLEALIRRDGSSRFGSNNKYGTFPSFSLGWVASKEAFWPSNDVVDFLKFRGGYGVVGNDNIGDFAYLATIGGGRNYTIGTEGSYLAGNSPNAPSNPDLKWEQTSQTNVGMDANLFRNVTLTIEWYKKVTTDILRNPRIPAYVGAISDPAANVADMKNTGLELELGYRNKLGQLNYSINGNVSRSRNEVTWLGNGLTYLAGGQSFQSSSYPITRTAVGQPINSFFGFRSMGIFQTQQEVDAYVNESGSKIQPEAQPGDFRWKDVNNDGRIDENDREFLGSPVPTWSYGLTVNAAYKNFDVVIFGQGSGGNKIFQGLRRLDLPNANWQTRALSRWTGAGTSNDYPRLVAGDPNKNFSSPSDFYLESGNYFRIKTLQLGYSFPKGLISKAGMQRLRLYVMSENLLTFTRYTGFDPEIGDGVMSIDRGIYPQPRSFMVGINVGF